MASTAAVVFDQAEEFANFCFREAQELCAPPFSKEM